MAVAGQIRDPIYISFIDDQGGTHTFALKEAIVMKNLPAACLLGGPFLAQHRLTINMHKRYIAITAEPDDRTLYRFPCTLKAFLGDPSISRISNANPQDRIPVRLVVSHDMNVLQPLESRRSAISFPQETIQPSLHYLYVPCPAVADSTGVCSSEGVIPINNPFILITNTSVTSTILAPEQPIGFLIPHRLIRTDAFEDANTQARFHFKELGEVATKTDNNYRSMILSLSLAHRVSASMKEGRSHALRFPEQRSLKQRTEAIIPTSPRIQ